MYNTINTAPSACRTSQYDGDDDVLELSYSIKCGIAPSFYFYLDKAMWKYSKKQTRPDITLVLRLDLANRKTDLILAKL